MYEGRFSVAQNQVSGIDETFVNPYPAQTKRCTNEDCGRRMSYLNSGTMCFSCTQKAECLDKCDPSRYRRTGERKA